MLHAVEEVILVVTFGTVLYNNFQENGHAVFRKNEKKLNILILIFVKVNRRGSGLLLKTIISCF